MESIAGAAAERPCFQVAPVDAGAAHPPRMDAEDVATAHTSTTERRGPPLISKVGPGLRVASVDTVVLAQAVGVVGGFVLGGV